MTRPVLGAFVLLLATLTAAAAGPADEPQRPTGRAVFLDPAFGGKEPGPMLGKIAGKVVTLEIAKEAYRALRSRNISVHLSRGRDVTVSAEERIVKARKTGGELYVSLRVSSDDANCVQVSVPAFPAQSSGDSTDAYLMNLLWERLKVQSGELAEAVRRQMKIRGIALCGEVSVRNDTVLQKSMLPAVIADWKTGGAGPSPVDTALQKRIARALAEGIREYSTRSEGAGQQH